MTHRQLFEDYVNGHIDQIYRFTYGYMGNPQDAEDVVSDSIVKALQGLDQLREPAFLGTWFHRIIINTAKSALAKRSRTIPIDPQDEASQHLFEAALDKEEIRSDDTLILGILTPQTARDLSLEDLLKPLSDNAREIIVLRFLEDMTLPDIADLLTINLNTVKTRLYRALHQLRTYLDEKEAYEHD